MKSSMCRAPISRADVKLSLNFLTYILKYNPSERPSAREAMKHSLVCKGTNPFTPQTKDIKNVGRTVQRLDIQNANVSCGDGALVAPQNDVESPAIETNIVLPSPARLGIGKRFKHWLTKKVRGLKVKKEGYVSRYSTVHSFTLPSIASFNKNCAS